MLSFFGGNANTSTATPIAAPTREQHLIDAAIVKGRYVGYPDQIICVAIEAQITASKQMQEELIRSWREANEGTFSSVPDFIDETRPKIEEATDRIIQELGVTQSILQTCAAATALRRQPSGIPASNAVWETAVEGLIKSIEGPSQDAS